MINESIIFDDHVYKSNLSNLKKSPTFSKAFRFFYRNRKEIRELKKYYNEIFKNDLSFFKKINDEKYIQNVNVNLIHEISNYLLLRCFSVTDLGILKGKMGIIIFLFHYSKHINSDQYEELTRLLLDDLCNSLNSEMSYSFESGLSGIGWGIQYLFLQNFISGDINEILEDFDNEIIKIDFHKMENLSLNIGLGGIVQYINARLYAIITLSLNNPFEESYLRSLYLKLEKIVENDEIDTDSIDIFVNYIMFYKNEYKLKVPSIYDVTNLDFPKDYSIRKYNLGLNGTANVGLKLIMEA
ncbi:MAG: hypothetical protein LBG96_06120 [Tannerella sp.]|jgi:hypothetical protein|nr:hypothetical protein [Tannerella sp.]